MMAGVVWLFRNALKGESHEESPINNCFSDPSPVVGTKVLTNA